MAFSSLIFMVAFFPFAFLGYFIICRGRRNWQNLFLLLISLIFYAAGEPSFVFVLIFSCLINWLIALAIFYLGKFGYQRQKHLMLILALILNFSILFWYKYLIFSSNLIKDVFSISLNVPSVLLPIGLSFFTFQSASYVIDVYRGSSPAQKNPINVALYISFFPQLVAGPIVRYSTIENQILKREESFELFSQGVIRFMIGFSKKILLANTIAVIANKAFDLPANELTISFAWIGMVAYTLQIYYDFSGYSDMALGLGKMFGFHFDENFNYPYIANSVTDFWRRWHISLGSWFRDYVYFPLGGSYVKTKSRLIWNLFLVWLLTGIWHGANYTFILWGVLYFILLSLEKVTQLGEALRSHRIFAHLYTMFFVMLGWVIFRSPSVRSAFVYIGTLFDVKSLSSVGMTRVYLSENMFFLACALIFSTPVVKKLIAASSDNVSAKFIYNTLVMAAFLVSLIYVINGSYNPFIYFNF